MEITRKRRGKVKSRNMYKGLMDEDNRGGGGWTVGGWRWVRKGGIKGEMGKTVIQ